MLRTHTTLLPLFASLLLLVTSLLFLFLERKAIGLAQKRLGISFLGRNGWAHLPADLLKFWFKYSAKHQGSWLGASSGLTGLALAFLSWNMLSVVFLPSDKFAPLADLWDFQLFVFLAYGALSNIFMFHAVVSLKSKYATLAGARALLLSTFMEVFFSLAVLLLAAHCGTLSFSEVASVTAESSLLFALPPLSLILLIYSLFEAKRAPFDHTEAESELVAGHLVEFGGRVLLFFYLAEYVHVFFCVFLVYTFLFAGLGPASVLGAWPAVFDALCSELLT